MEAAKLYANVPLELGSQRIRLVELLPRIESEVIQCKFHCVSLVDCPEYVALSYAWGPPKSFKHVLLDDAKFPVRRNLWWFLHCARNRGSETQLFWIDALCIDQSNRPERSHQIGLMGKIYSAATSVVVWLGEADKEAGSDSQWTLLTSKDWLRFEPKQEIMHAKDLTVFCGNKSFPWQKINQIFQKMRRVDERGHIVHHQNAAAILDSPASVVVKAKSVWHGDRIPLLSLLETYRDLQSTELRDKVIGLLGLASGGELANEEAAISLVEYSIPLIEFFWRVLEWIWKDSCLSDRDEMSRAAESLKNILKVYVSENELSKKINTSDWTKISDLAERRRIQNRIAQRNYRKKLKRRLEELEKYASSTSASTPPRTMPDQYTP